MICPQSVFVRATRADQAAGDTMANATERSCSMLIYNDKQSTASEIKEALEGSDTEQKILAMQKAIVLLLSGEQLPQLFITIVRYVLPSEDHTVQKLLLLYLVRANLAPARQEWCSRAPTSSAVLTCCCCPDPAGSNREDGLCRQSAARDGAYSSVAAPKKQDLVAVPAAAAVQGGVQHYTAAAHLPELISMPQLAGSAS